MSTIQKMFDIMQAIAYNSWENGYYVVNENVDSTSQFFGTDEDMHIDGKFIAFYSCREHGPIYDVDDIQFPVHTCGRYTMKHVEPDLTLHVDGEELYIYKFDEEAK